MSDSDAGTSTGSTPYESEDEMICYITGYTQSASGHPDLPDARRLNEESLHSRQMQTETTPFVGASVAAADGGLGPDTDDRLNKASVFTRDVPSPIPAVGSAQIPYTTGLRSVITADRAARGRLSVASDKSALGADPSIRRRLTRNLSGTRAKYRVSEAPVDSGQIIDTPIVVSSENTLGTKDMDQASPASATRNVTDMGSVVSRDSGVGSMRSVQSDMENDTIIPVSVRTLWEKEGDE